jgi:protein-S-isoprenylcysteine O-methyltransferase Ste14
MCGDHLISLLVVERPDRIHAGGADGGDESCHQTDQKQDSDRDGNVDGRDAKMNPGSTSPMRFLPWRDLRTAKETGVSASSEFQGVHAIIQDLQMQEFALTPKSRWVLFSVLGFASSVNGVHELFSSIMPIIGFGVVLGLSISALGIVFIGQAVIALQRSAQNTLKVVRSGPYGLVRNPAYLGGILINLGLMISAAFVAIWGGDHAIDSVQLISVCAGGIASYWLAALTEERYNINRFGESYRRYAKEVPRLNLVKGWRQFKKHRKKEE